MSINELRKAIQDKPEPRNPSIELNGTAIMYKIQVALAAFAEDSAPSCIWLGSETYRRIARASRDANWAFSNDFDNEGERIFGVSFLVDDEYGENAIGYEQ